MINFTAVKGLTFVWVLDILTKLLLILKQGENYEKDLSTKKSTQK